MRALPRSGGDAGHVRGGFRGRWKGQFGGAPLGRGGRGEDHGVTIGAVEVQLATRFGSGGHKFAGEREEAGVQGRVLGSDIQRPVVGQEESKGVRGHLHLCHQDGEDRGRRAAIVSVPSGVGGDVRGR